MRTSFFGIIRTRYFAAATLAISALFMASITLADIVTGASSTHSSTDVTTTQVTIDQPALIVPGDFLLASIAINGGSPAAITPPSGWTQIVRTDNDTNISIVSYWKIAGASEPANYVWSITPQTRAQGGITRYTGVDASSPIDTFSGNFGLSKAATTSSITTTTSNSKVVALFATDIGKNNNAGDYFSQPTGMTEQYDASNVTLGPSIAADDVTQSTAGSSGSKSSTISGNKNRNWVAQQIALRRVPVTPAINGAITTRAVNDTTSTTTTIAHTVNSGANQILIVTATALGGEDTSATYNGVSMTKGAAHGNGTEMYYSYWYLVNPAQGTHNLVLTNPSGFRQYAVMTVANVDQSTPFDADAHFGATADLTPSVSVTTTASNELILYFLAYDDTPSLVTYTPNDSELYYVNSDSSGITNKGNKGATHTQASAGTVSVGGTIAADPSHAAWDLVAVPIRPTP